ncbi:MAG: alpha/beta hydrolase [Lacinutrix venerupis]
MKKSLLILIFSIFFLGCKKTPENIDSIPEHDSLTIASKMVNEDRVINVWTPKSYKDGNESFPVLYMPDGGIKEDFNHIANTLAKLINNKNIPPIILVGIENTERGRDLTGFSSVKDDAQYCPLTDGAKNFRLFIINELIPEINTKYRTTNRKGIIGESLAGLFVMETFFLTPETFNFYIAMDPSLWWNNHYLEQNTSSFLKEFPEQEIKLWFAGSNTEDISTHTRSIYKSFKDNAPENLIYKYSDEPNEKHNTIFRATKEKALIWSLNNN